jgi:phage terminase small subunit
MLYSIPFSLLKNHKEGGEMPKCRSEKAEMAEKLFNEGMAMIDIAKRLNISDSTIRSWKRKYEWDVAKKNDCNVAKNKCNVANEKVQRYERKKPKNKKKKEVIAPEVEEVCKNTELTDKQRLFCVYYTRYFNATKAYQKAYECSYETACTCGPRMLENVGIKNTILDMKKAKLNQSMLAAEDIFQKVMDIAFADMTDYVEFGNKQIDVRNDATGKLEKVPTSYLYVKDSKSVDGTLIDEISKIKGEVKVKLIDKKWAVKWLADHMGFATEEQRARIDALKAKAGTDGKSTAVDDWIAAVLDDEVIADE